jgi:peptide/nickel transport system permease protein
VVNQATEVLPGGVPGSARATSRWREAGWLRDPGIMIPGSLLALILLACFAWPEVYPVPQPVGGSLLQANQPAFSAGHLLGTDSVGNDLLSRCLYGGRVSLEIAAASVAVGLVVGGLLGIVAVFAGPWGDAAIMRVIDMLIAFPALILFLVIVDGLGPSELNVVWAISVFTVPAFARVARAATLEVRTQVFITAAELVGTRPLRLVFRHVVPNILPQLVTFCCLLAGVVVLVSGALSFLGLGVPPPTPSWGNMISDGQQVLASRPLLALVPSAFLFVTVLVLNLLGDRLRDRWGVQ